MRVFLSWSGKLSHDVAIKFKEWLPLVIQSVDAYVSSEDIDKGSRWSTHIASELETCSYGIICVTKENLAAPWVNFEAGALSKFVDDSFVSPFLVNLRKSEVKGPLLQFQSTSYEKEDVRSLLKSINKALGEQGLDEIRLNNVFDAMWPLFENGINEAISNNLVEVEEGEKESGYNSDINENILEELLELSRSQQKLLNSPRELIPTEYFREQIGYVMEDVTLLMDTSRDLQAIRNWSRQIIKSINKLEETYRSIPSRDIFNYNPELRESKVIHDLLKEIKENQERFMREATARLREMYYMNEEIIDKINPLMSKDKNMQRRNIGKNQVDNVQTIE